MAWNDLDFVRCAFVTVLGRQPDRQGEEYYVDRLRRGFSKYGILWQLRRSIEGRRHDPGIAGFDRELRKHHNARNRFYGWIVRLGSGREADTPLERRLRAIENRLVSIPVIAAEISALANIVQAGPRSGDQSELHSMEAEISAVRHRLSSAAQKFYDRVYKL
jgi:hypothetical protein